MKEYLTQAVVLWSKPRGEFDRFVELYTKNLGRVGARVVGGRRILSKLTPHLEPATLITVRLVQKSNFTVADALTQDRFLSFKKNHPSYSKTQSLFFLLHDLVPKAVPDLRLWHELLRSLQNNQINFRVFLKLLGYDSVSASCEVCSSKNISHFFVPDQSFLCSRCHGKFPQNALILID